MKYLLIPLLFLTYFSFGNSDESFTMITTENVELASCEEFGGFPPDITVGTSSSSFTFSSSLGTGWSNQNIKINGTILVNSNFSINNCNLSFGSKGYINVQTTGVNLDIDDSNLFACQEMWRGIRVHRGSLNLDNSSIEDAQYGVSIGNNGSAHIFQNDFNRNHIGVYASLSQTNSATISVFQNNSFRCSNNLNAPYAGQSPTPDNISFAGVYLINFNGVGILGSEFDNQMNGVILDDCIANVSNNTFNDMLIDTYQGYPSLETGCGIFALDSELTASGNDAANSSATHGFVNCEKACIYTRDSDITSSKNNSFEVDRVSFGYDIEGVKVGDVNIFQNDFVLLDGLFTATTGIKADFIGVDIDFDATNNTFTGSGFVTALDLDMNSATTNSSGCEIKLNDIDFTNAERPAIFMTTNNYTGSIDVSSNFIDYYGNTSQSFTNIIAYSSSPDNSTFIQFNYNEITAHQSGNNYRAFFINDVEGDIQYCNNILDGSDRGMEFDGQCRVNEVYGTTFVNHGGTGLFMQGAVTEIGIQTHHQNDWQAGSCCGFREADAPASNFNTAASRFIVDGNANASFLPSPVNPTGWFCN